MTNQELQKLKCYIVSKQHDIVILNHYGVECDRTEMEEDLNAALHLYYSYIICPTESCELDLLIQRKINTCVLPLVPCTATTTLNCNAISIDDSDIPTPPCNTLTIQWLQ